MSDRASVIDRLDTPLERPEIYRSTKSYDHSEGLSCCFRQWRATHSHCRLVHGYALAFKFVFATHRLDERHWCFDFGGLKPIPRVAARDLRPHHDRRRGRPASGVVPRPA